MKQTVGVIAADLKVGMRILLDMGYFHTREEWCRIQRITVGKSLFGHPVVRIQVNRYDGTVVNLADYTPARKLTVEVDTTNLKWYT
jgi:hypothetical protein